MAKVFVFSFKMPAVLRVRAVTAREARKEATAWLRDNEVGFTGWLPTPELPSNVVNLRCYPHPADQLDLDVVEKEETCSQSG